ncbi:MAG: Protein transport protein S9 plasma membrane t-SNARE [Peltula sp. TS41687]|nr:MAG: Protein transport protein S9 plasma membrane t-SNARE [Peltula sp. TS41687]
MGKFGFGKKSSSTSEAADEDSNRSSLFGSRSSSNKKSSSPAPPSSNPYAQSPSSNPYAQQQNDPDPYAQDTNKYAGMGSSYLNSPPPPAGASGRPSPGMNANQRLPPYGNAERANQKYAAGSGYGTTNRYEAGGGGGGAAESRYGQQGSSDGPAAAAPSRYGPGGYGGGLGRTSSAETSTTDINRDALFGEARDRYQQRSQTGAPSENPVEGSDGGSGYGSTPGAAYGDTSGSGYGAYGEHRQLTAEEEEEEDVQATKQQIRQMKQEDVASSRNALRIAAQAEETGRNTLARLAAQGERIHNTEKNLDLATNQGRIAEERAKELKTLNKSMFAVHVSNPLTSASRRRLRDEDVMSKHRSEREQRDATRAAAFESKARVEGSWKELGGGGSAAGGNDKAKSRLAERAKYQFEADSEDDEMENEIDSNFDALGQAAGRLNVLARATGKEVDDQNKHIDTIISKSDRVDDQIAMNRARLDRIH